MRSEALSLTLRPPSIHRHRHRHRQPPRHPGPAFVGAELGRRFGFGLYAVEYPGYGICALDDAQTPSESAAYEAADALLSHFESNIGAALRDKLDGGDIDTQGPSKVSRGPTVIVGQSIGCAIAVEMARRGFGDGLVLISVG